MALKFTTEHEWLRAEADSRVTVGITDYAQGQLGDIVFIELPEIGARCGPSTNLVVIESVKAVGEIKMPVLGTVMVINARLADEPELVNRDPLGDGWLVQLRVDELAGLETLMDEAAYTEYLATL